MTLEGRVNTGTYLLSVKRQPHDAEGWFSEMWMAIPGTGKFGKD